MARKPKQTPNVDELARKREKLLEEMEQRDTTILKARGDLRRFRLQLRKLDDQLEAAREGT